uniref:Uncharacterized protein n=1 Tax=Cucumis sativus TaxID=3659 RepID=A0A0A0KVJ1_CUCSA
MTTSSEMELQGRRHYKFGENMMENLENSNLENKGQQRLLVWQKRKALMKKKLLRNAADCHQR